MENAEHKLFVCARWGVVKEAVGQAVGAQFNPDAMVSLMLQPEQIWMLVESFVTLVMKTRELDGCAERSRNEGQQNLHRGLHPRSCVSSGLSCPKKKTNYYCGKKLR